MFKIDRVSPSDLTYFSAQALRDRERSLKEKQRKVTSDVYDKEGTFRDIERELRKITNEKLKRNGRNTVMTAHN